MATALEQRRVEEAAHPSGAGLPHTTLYPSLGAVLGAGSPVGAFLCRILVTHDSVDAHWVRAELHENALFYWYMGIGTVLAFAAFGFVVGRRSERQRASNAALRERVRVLHLSSITDGLTGAYSHAYLQEALQLEVTSARQSARPLSVLMLDLDDFKKVNDTHGHLFGDRVLREVTETISATVREADVVARYGGEEFVVVMPGADVATAVRVADRVRLAASRAPITDGPAAPVYATLSVGVANFPGAGDETALSILQRADENLYRAKREGKNRTVS